jgi:UDP-N-acetylglucosamine--N-acetylmuramyl-(pentapeptide) pyrophosphoryl-undecaprenol N-acetylglucosamine transferase
MRIVCNGGHLTPMYSFAEIAVNKGDHLLLVGSQGSNSIEATELRKLGVSYAIIPQVKFDRYHRIKSVLRFPLILFSIGKSIYILNKFKAQVVVTFGSFNAVPLGLAAVILRIPFVIHEQTHKIGLANRILLPFAAACAFSYKDSCKENNPKRALVIGNPVRREFWNPPITINSKNTLEKPIIYITGGNQGSKSIVDVCLKLAPELVNSYTLVIQYGKVKPLVAAAITNRIIMSNWFDSKEASYFMNQAHIIVSRGGANTLAELMIIGKPSIIIPLPDTSADEQTTNAQFLAEKNASIVISQQDLTTKALLTAIHQIEQNYQQFKTHAKSLRSYQNPNAALDLYSLAVSTVRKQ